MSWPAALLALLVSHMAGDVLIQSEWQAHMKVHGLADTTGRQALIRHVAALTMAD